jgi:hypothetical protein
MRKLIKMLLLGFFGALLPVIGMGNEETRSL